MCRIYATYQDGVKCDMIHRKLPPGWQSHVRHPSRATAHSTRSPTTHYYYQNWNAIHKAVRTAREHQYIEHVSTREDYFMFTNLNLYSGTSRKQPPLTTSLGSCLWKVSLIAIWLTEFDCPVAHQNVSLLATAHDCETGLWNSLPFCLPSLIVQWPARIFHF